MSVNTPYRINNSANQNFVLDCNIYSADAATVHTYHGGPNQVFYLENSGAGFLIRCKSNGKVLEVPEFTDGADGTKLRFAFKNGSDRQRWSIQDSGNGALKISGYNSKFFGPNNGTLSNLNPVVLQTDLKPTSTWILRGI